VIGTGGTKGHDDTPAATAASLYPAPVEFDTFTATRTRSDGFGFRQRDAK
jgi:hypothetical protein